MRVIRRLAAALALAALIVQLPVLHAQSGLTGEWEITFDSNQDTSTISVTFKQEGDKLTGTVNTQLSGPVPLTGTVKDDAVVFSASMAFQGLQLKLIVDAKLKNGVLNGTVKFGGGADFPCVGRRAPKPAASQTVAPP